ncbi:hypothetical protein CM15mP43_11840 [bacterium]|nr:MAG: hypothetical protein CM15mP43_11840 [bacterium]
MSPLKKIEEDVQENLKLGDKQQSHIIVGHMLLI